MHCHRRRHIAFPLFLIFWGVLYLMGDAGIVRSIHFHQVWPLMLIALGVDQLYGWSTSGSRQ